MHQSAAAQSIDCADRKTVHNTNTSHRVHCLAVQTVLHNWLQRQFGVTEASRADSWLVGFKSLFYHHAVELNFCIWQSSMCKSFVCRCCANCR